MSCGVTAYGKQRVITFTCDACGSSEEIHQLLYDVREAQRMLREKGWTLGKHDKCCKCNSKKGGEKLGGGR